ncbi:MULTISPECIES: site-specific DNA-methyltransferase [Pseudomonas]|uniref:site-specific DNA-methyltransferase n=1 Tax=Pseudomonas TaxID=286 RepID=UPI000B007109|nr:MULTISPECIES: site-specific DNA-methyltransferase [Pseudomonas]
MTLQKIDAQSPEAQSADLKAENIAKLKALFPELITEGPNGVAINQDVLKQLVGDATVTDADEKYGLNWHGKRTARQLALTPSTGTLLPCPNESVDWDTTQNLMIEGDNLEVLKLLQKSYAGKVKLIYIDPPYNTGQDFVYPDNFQDNIKNYLEITGQSVAGIKTSTNNENSGRYHTDWLNMIYPRLVLARSLLSPDGAIFISIDDHEIHHLRSMVSEVFGEENFSATAIWEKADSPRNSARQFSEDHDYILIFSKDPGWTPDRLPRTEAANAIYSNPDNDPRGEWLPGDPYANKPYSKGKYTISGPTGRSFSPPPGRFWRISEEKLRELDADGRIWWGPKGDARPSIKRYLTEVADLTPRTLWKKEDVGSNRTSKNELRSLFPESESFDTPKPIRLIERVLQLATSPKSGDIVLDFFAGSGTTGHATLSLNSADDGNRRFILVQLPEPIVSGAFENIAEITKERLRRAGTKIKAESSMFSGDTGFRTFKLDTSNIRAWNPTPEDLTADLLAHQEHVIEGRSESDILYELLLKLGLDLCVPIEHQQIAGKTVYSIGGGVLLACLAEQITRDQVEELAQGMVAWHKGQAPASDSTCVFRDSAFADDIAKTNLAAILNQAGIKNVRSL